MSKKTEIVYILDRSGSMGKIWNDAFEGLNHFIEDQKKVEGECKFSLVLFDDQYTDLITAKDVQSVEPIKSTEAFPRGCTALLDAIGKTANFTEQRLNKLSEGDRPEKVLVVIMTDGYENASREYSRAQVRDIIKNLEDEQSWEFIFMGADMDAVTEGANLGMKLKNTANFDKSKQGTESMRLYASATVTGYRTGNN